MDTHKYSEPKLPTMQSVLEDLSKPSIAELSEELKFTNSGDLHNIYECYLNYKNLKKDLIKQNQLTAKLEDLNKELVLNIENMKKQQ